MVYSVYDLRDKVKEIVRSIFDIYDIKEFRGCHAMCTLCEGGVIRFNGTYKIFAGLDVQSNFIKPLDGFMTVTFDVVDNAVANLGVTTTFLPDIASCSMAEEIKGQLNEWLKEAAKPKIWVGSAPVDPEIKEKFRKFIKGEQKAIWDAYIPDTIKRYIENDPVIMSKNYISEERKGMKIKISLDEFEAICKKACCEYFNDKPKAYQYCYATNNRGIDTDRMVLKVELSFIPNNVLKCRHIVIFKFNGISGDVDYAACPSLPSGTGDAICGIICRMIRNQCMGIEYTVPLGDVMILHNYISEEENNMIEGKRCINRADVYKTMTDDQKIVMQDAIANAVESTIKDCRMEYEKTLKAQKLQIENYKGLINSIYGTNGALSKLDQLKNSLEVQKIIINEPAMIVFWKDGTKTVVTATDEEFDEEKGLAMAFAKKWLGNNYAAGGRFKAKLKHAERVNKNEKNC